MDYAFDPGHDPDCSGCPTCSREMAVILENPTNLVVHEAARAAHMARHAARAAEPECACSYGPALAARAAAERLPANPQWPVLKDSAIENIIRKGLADRVARDLWVKANERNPVPDPPDSYALALKARKENT